MTTENTTQVPETTPDETSAPSTVDDTATIDRATFDDLYAQVTGLLGAWGDLNVEMERADRPGVIWEQLELIEDRIHYLRRTLATVMMEPTAASTKGHAPGNGIDYASANPWRLEHHDDDAAPQSLAGLEETYIAKIKLARAEAEGHAVAAEDAAATVAYYTGKLDGLRGRPDEDTGTEGQDPKDDADAAANEAFEGLKELGLVAVTDAPQGDDEAPEAPEEARR